MFVDGQNSVAIVREKIVVPELSIIPYEHEDEANSIRQGSHRWRTARPWQSFRSVQAVGKRSANRVRPCSKNSLRSRTSWGTQPWRQETLGQRSHPNFRKGTLNGAVVNLGLLSEKHCRVICTVLQLALFIYRNI